MTSWLPRGRELGVCRDSGLDARRGRAVCRGPATKAVGVCPAPPPYTNNIGSYKFIE